MTSKEALNYIRSGLGIEARDYDFYKMEQALKTIEKELKQAEINKKVEIYRSACDTYAVGGWF